MADDRLTGGQLNSISLFIDGLASLSQEYGVYLWHPGDLVRLEGRDGESLGVNLSDYDRDAERYEAVILR